MAFRCRVTLLPRQGSSSFDSWEEEVASSVVYADGSTEVTKWYETMLALSERARSSETRGCDVVLCVLGDQLTKRWDYDLLRALLQNARDSCWGAPLFLVVSRDIRPDKLTRQRVLIDRWLQAALAGRVFDLLQLSYDPDLGDLPEDPELRLCCEEALERQRFMHTLSHNGNWACSLSDRRLAFRKLLGSLACQPGGEIQAQHLILVVDRGNAKDQRAFVEQRIIEFGARIGLIATLGNSPTGALEQVCHEAGLPPPLSFRAELEIWYLLLRLNARHRPPVLDQREGLQVVSLNVAPRFQPPTDSGPISILFTSSFVPGFDSSEQAAQAARDIGAMLERTSVITHYDVDQRVTPDRMRAIAREMEPPLIWVHIGHGLGQAGLEDASREPVHPDRWLACFGGWKGSLPLAIFLSCSSLPVAECFARAGAGVAIGFEGEVLSSRSRLLAIEVLDAALTSGGRRGPILDAFEAGRDHLKAAGHPSPPIAFYTEP
jgi:hypothetical protein